MFGLQPDTFYHEEYFLLNVSIQKAEDQTDHQFKCKQQQCPTHQSIKTPHSYPALCSKSNTMNSWTSDKSDHKATDCPLLGFLQIFITVI